MRAKASSGPRPKHVPRRMCVACRQGDAKRELVRIVRIPACGVQVDVTGRLAGRGAYLCRRRQCWELAAKKKILERALQTTLEPEEKAALGRFGASLSED